VGLVPARLYVTKYILHQSYCRVCNKVVAPEVEPTNNLAERVLRPTVRQRKISGCYRSFEEAHHRDVIMSVMGTMQIQGKDFLEDGRECF